MKRKLLRKPNLYGLAALSAVVLCLLILLLVKGGTPGLQWGSALLALYFGLAFAQLLTAFRRQLRYNLYSYNTHSTSRT